jgi:hypothetical protein
MCLADGLNVTAYILFLSVIGVKTGNCLNFAFIAENFSLSSKILTIFCHKLYNYYAHNISTLTQFVNLYGENACYEPSVAAPRPGMRLLAAQILLLPHRTSRHSLGALLPPLPQPPLETRSAQASSSA